MNSHLSKKSGNSEKSYSTLAQRSETEERHSKTIFVVDAGKNLYNLAVEIRNSGGLDAYLDRDKPKTSSK